MPIYKVRHDAMLMDDDTYWIHRIEEVEAGSVEEAIRIYVKRSGNEVDNSDLITCEDISMIVTD